MTVGRSIHYLDDPGIKPCLSMLITPLKRASSHEGEKDQYHAEQTQNNLK
jgi:hypothetical protein